MPHLKENFNTNGTLKNTSLLSIQRIWEDSSSNEANLRVPEIGLFSFEKELAFYKAFKKMHDSDLPQNKIHYT